MQQNVLPNSKYYPPCRVGPQLHFILVHISGESERLVFNPNVPKYKLYDFSSRDIVNGDEVHISFNFRARLRYFA